MVKSKKVENPVRDFIVTLVMGITDIFLKPTRDKIVKGTLKWPIVIFTIITTFLIIVLGLQSKDMEDNKDAVTDSQKVQLTFTVISVIALLTILLLFSYAFKTGKDSPLIRFLPKID